MVVDDGQDGYALVVVEVAVAVVELPGFVWLVCFESFPGTAWPFVRLSDDVAVAFEYAVDSRCCW